jgi:hypothetical protein
MATESRRTRDSTGGAGDSRGAVEGEALDRELAELLEVETFEPSPEFRKPC